ncbi:major facilitator superfamily domain-containing protein [Mycena galericulata]|nr:major facilitator superfamily domain-containing protein [Mycena galericulata]
MILVKRHKLHNMRTVINWQTKQCGRNNKLPAEISRILQGSFPACRNLETGVRDASYLPSELHQNESRTAASTRPLSAAYTYCKFPPDHMASHSVDSEPTADTAAKQGEAMESTILSGKRLAVVFVAIFRLGDNISPFFPPATALPRIASDFDSFSLQGWVATSFVLTQSVFILFYGQLLRIFAAKWVLVTAIVIFETGSLICGVSHNVDQLIAGRAVSGLGAAGIFVAMIQIISQVTRLEDRPRLFGLFGAVFGLSSIVGPLIGGGFTDHVTWRWCFFINLPGGVSLTAVTFLLKAAPPLGSDPNKRAWKDLLRQVSRMDFFGAILVAGAVTTLVLALQWGGNTKPWNDKAVITCFVLAGVLAGAFIAWEIFTGDRAMTPIVIFHSKSIYAVVAYCFLTRFSLLLYSYAVRHHSATKSGVDLLPFLLGVISTVISSGIIVGKVGYYWHFLVCAPIFLAVGSGLLYTLSTSTSSAKIVGFQILVGMGTGMGMQNAILAIQVEFKDKPKLLAQATSVASFAQFLGGTIGLGVAEPVFSSELGKYLLRYAPEAPAEIVRESPTAIYSELPAAMIPGVVQAYMQSLRVVFLLGVPVAGLALLASMVIQNIKIEKTVPADVAPAKENGDAEKGGEVETGAV